MSTYWPTEDGWPYADTAAEEADLGSEVDDDLLSVRIPSRHLMDDLDPLEREVVAARFGLSGHEVRSMRQLQRATGHTQQELSQALGSGLAKLKTQLS